MQPTVEKAIDSGNVEHDIRQLVDRLGGIERFVHPGERVLIKPACNSPFSFPATTDLGVIRAVVELVRTQTANVAIGDSSGFVHKPTRDAFDGMGLTTLAREIDVPLIDFDEHEWRARSDPRARKLVDIHMTGKLDEFDRLIVLPTIRTHAWARITMALKIGVGLMYVKDRKILHQSALEEKVADLNLYYTPDLIILDGRKCFISGGPDRGEERAPGVMFASTARTAADIEGIRVLQSFGAEGLEMPAEDVPMIRAARELGIP
jgi:uncharacterized protein (DUF362 family)